MLIDDLYRLKKSELSTASRVLDEAFIDDPVFSEVFKKASPEQRTAFYESTLRFCNRFGAVYAPNKDIGGVAGWVPGERSDWTMWRMLISGALRAGTKMGTDLANYVGEVFQPVDEDRQENMRNKKFHFLAIIGVAKGFQGQGYGSQLINALIEKCESDSRDLYLETETEENVQFYMKYGFEVVKQVNLPLINLPMWEMVREVEKSK